MGGRAAATKGWVTGLALVALVGCRGAEGPAPAQPEPAPTVAQPAPTRAPVPATRTPPPTIETPSFFLGTAASDAPYASGSSGAFAIHLEGRGPWKVNQEYPLRIAVSAPEETGVRKANLEPTDAALWTEQAARFDVAFRPTTVGEHDVKCEVSFSMCTPEQCIIETRTVALQMAVN